MVMLYRPFILSSCLFPNADHHYTKIIYVGIYICIDCFLFCMKPWEMLNNHTAVFCTNIDIKGTCDKIEMNFLCNKNIRCHPFKKKSWAFHERIDSSGACGIIWDKLYTYMNIYSQSLHGMEFVFQEPLANVGVGGGPVPTPPHWPNHLWKARFAIPRTRPVIRDTLGRPASHSGFRDTLAKSDCL